MASVVRALSIGPANPTATARSARSAKTAHAVPDAAKMAIVVFNRRASMALAPTARELATTNGCAPSANSAARTTRANRTRMRTASARLAPGGSASKIRTAQAHNVACAAIRPCLASATSAARAVTVAFAVARPGAQPALNARRASSATSAVASTTRIAKPAASTPACARSTPTTPTAPSRSAAPSFARASRGLCYAPFCTTTGCELGDCPKGYTCKQIIDVGGRGCQAQADCVAPRRCFVINETSNNGVCECLSSAECASGDCVDGFCILRTECSPAFGLVCEDIKP